MFSDTNVTFAITRSAEMTRLTTESAIMLWRAGSRGSGMRTELSASLGAAQQNTSICRSTACKVILMDRRSAMPRDWVSTIWSVAREITAIMEHSRICHHWGKKSLTTRSAMISWSSESRSLPRLWSSQSSQSQWFCACGETTRSDWLTRGFNKMPIPTTPVTTCWKDLMRVVTVHLGWVLKNARDRDTRDTSAWRNCLNMAKFPFMQAYISYLSTKFKLTQSFTGILRSIVYVRLRQRLAPSDSTNSR